MPVEFGVDIRPQSRSNGYVRWAITGLQCPVAIRCVAVVEFTVAASRSFLNADAIVFDFSVHRQAQGAMSAGGANTESSVGVADASRKWRRYVYCIETAGEWQVRCDLVSRGEDTIVVEVNPCIQSSRRSVAYGNRDGRRGSLLQSTDANSIFVVNAIGVVTVRCGGWLSVGFSIDNRTEDWTSQEVTCSVWQQRAVTLRSVAEIKPFFRRPFLNADPIVFDFSVHCQVQGAMSAGGANTESSVGVADASRKWRRYVYCIETAGEWQVRCDLVSRGEDTIVVEVNPCIQSSRRSVAYGNRDGRRGSLLQSTDANSIFVVRSLVKVISVCQWSRLAVKFGVDIRPQSRSNGYV